MTEAKKSSIERLHNAEYNLVKQGYKYHHWAYRRGYTPIDKVGDIEYYGGKFGEGYIVLRGHRYNGNSPTYYSEIAYYIKEA